MPRGEEDQWNGHDLARVRLCLWNMIISHIYRNIHISADPPDLCVHGDKPDTGRLGKSRGITLEPLVVDATNPTLDLIGCTTQAMRSGPQWLSSAKDGSLGSLETYPTSLTQFSVVEPHPSGAGSAHSGKEPRSAWIDEGHPMSQHNPTKAKQDYLMLMTRQR